MADKQIEDLLLSLGIGHQYYGHRMIASAVQRVIQDENNLLCLKSGILLPLASLYNCSWHCIERNLRTAIRRAWRQNAPLLIQIAAFPMLNMPTVSEFIDILASYIIRTNTLNYLM